jgi:hypothetical protein
MFAGELRFEQLRVRLDDCDWCTQLVHHQR